MNSDQFRRHLAKQGVTFEPGKGGHLVAKLNGKKTDLPQHGGKKQLGKGLRAKIERDLGLR